MLIAPICHIEAIDRTELNRLLVAWEHRMGPMRRPNFKIEGHHALFQNGEPVAVTSAGETVGHVVGQTGIRRDQCIELMRLCAARRDLCRPMLRLWREMIWPALAAVHCREIAVSYQDTALHRGDVYRFDGWLDLAGCRSGLDRRTGRPGRKMRIWAWPPDKAREMQRGRDISPAVCTSNGGGARCHPPADGE